VGANDHQHCAFVPAHASYRVRRIGQWGDLRVLEHFLDSAEVESESFVAEVKYEQIGDARSGAYAVAKAHNGR
jgi:hypothetical protein